MSEKQLTQLENIVAIQTSDGNWNADPYMHGMANGLILALAIAKGEEPKYLAAPTEWLSDKAASTGDTSTVHNNVDI